MNDESVPFRFFCHFRECWNPVFALVPMLQPWEPIWYAFPRWSMGTRKVEFIEFIKKILCDLCVLCGEKKSKKEN